MEMPFTQFAEWFAEAKATPTISEPTAMTLATATPEGKPSARIVLLKEFGPEGFVFYSNYTSRKGRELEANPQAALCFYWMPLDKQVRIEGRVTPVSDAEADAYFASRPRERQIGAWASLQSQDLAARTVLENRLVELEAAYPDTVPRPPQWSGWRLKPESIEFWHQNWARLHARERYQRTADGWSHTLLYP